VGSGEEPGPAPLTLDWYQGSAGCRRGVWPWVLARWATTHCGAAKRPGAIEAKPLRIPAAKGKESCFMSRFRGLL